MKKLIFWMGTHSGTTTLTLSFSLLPKWGSTHKRKNLILQEQILFPVRVDPLLKEFHSHGNLTEVTKFVFL